MASVKEINKPHEFIFPYYGQSLPLYYMDFFIILVYVGIEAVITELFNITDIKLNNIMK